MLDFTNIVIFCPLGISDTMMATPTAVALRQALPAARITWIAKTELKDVLISFCPSIDDVVEVDANCNRDRKIALINSLQPDLVVNLTNEPVSGRFSFKNFVFSGSSSHKFIEAAILQNDSNNTHFVDECLQTIAQLGIEYSTKRFPTIFPDALQNSVVAPLFQKYGLDPEQSKVGIVPGVGANFTSRAWSDDNWSYLLQSIQKHTNAKSIIIGGNVDTALCKQIADQAEIECVNLAGLLSLTETAALLDAMNLVIGGDCGIIHMAVAIGKPVIGLYGPTSSIKRGTYGQNELVIDQNKHCECPGLSLCNNMVKGPGNCMRSIELETVLDKVYAVLDRSDIDSIPERDSTNWFWVPKRSL